MKALIYLLILSILVSCSRAKDIQSDQQEKQEEFISSAKMFQRNDLPYHQFNPSIQFLTPKELPGKTMEGLIREQLDFIKASGLPDNTNLHEWSSSHTLQDALHIYKTYSYTNANHIYINSFKQYGGWLILTKMNLLSTGTEEDIAVVVKSLIDANYKGYGLLHYTLNQLNENNYDRRKISLWAQIIVNNAKEDDVLQDLDLNKLQLQNAPAVAKAPMEKLFRNFVENKRKDKTIYLEKISGFMLLN